MKKIIMPIFTLFILLVFISPIEAQDLEVVYDTIQFQRPDDYRDDYTLHDSLITKISVQTSAAVQMNNVDFKLGGDILRGALTLATGIGIGGAKEVDWYLPATIRTNNSKLDWISDIYCPGYIEKQRERVTNSDGSKSVETNYVNVFSWQKRALGYIIESGDTIGWHYVIKFPRTDSAVAQWAGKVYKYNSKQNASYNLEFAMVGEFTGKKSALLYKPEENRMYIFSEDKLQGIYQFTTPPNPLVRKKKRIHTQPYLLVEKSLTGFERTDVIRLAITGKRFRNAIENY
jgi:hypothetical protein